ncbi:hypothetical protein PR202_ga06403 [Eleusine coracana subsp. coracana]|uniref:Aminotransferase-like plant mobile domain-containing protein n=1 Tax=Eleusine coracana subsp. coracana TaxID=191504 RepID=A0AAV5BUS0_ELECO|nr:hypothetical protein PR202_ga06403 [Eleusine coracana subsp. coracana]
MDDAERERIEKLLMRAVAKFESTALERMEVWVSRCESDSLFAPPMEMLDYPDHHFQRAWGWNTILPRQDNTAPWSRYKGYLKEYYRRNQQDGDADDSGNGLSALADKCIKMEGTLLFLWDRYSREFSSDGDKIKRVSHMITKGAYEMTDALKVEYPAAAIALKAIVKCCLKCITAEAELICECLLSKTRSIFWIRLSNEIRQCASSFMFYTGPERDVAMAAMMNKAALWTQMKPRKISKYTLQRNCRLLFYVPLVELVTNIIHTQHDLSDDKIGSETEEVKEDNTMGKCTVGESILDGSADRNSETEEVKEDNTMGRSTVGEFILDGSADRNSSEKDNREERDNIHENAKNCYTNDLVKDDNLVDPDKMNQNTKLPAWLQLDNDESESANKNDQKTNTSEANKSERSSISLQRKKSDLKIHKAANIRTIDESDKETPLLEIPEEITTLEDVLELVSTINRNTDDDEGLLMKPHIAEKTDAEPHGAENLLEMIQQLEEAFDNQAVKVESVVGRVKKIQEEANAVGGELDAIKDGMKSHKTLLEKIIEYASS